MWQILGNASARRVSPGRPQYQNLDTLLSLRVLHLFERSSIRTSTLQYLGGFFISWGALFEDRLQCPSPLLSPPWTRAGAERGKLEIGTTQDFGRHAQAFTWILTGEVVVGKYKGATWTKFCIRRNHIFQPFTLLLRRVAVHVASESILEWVLPVGVLYISQYCCGERTDLNAPRPSSEASLCGVVISTPCVGKY